MKTILWFIFWGTVGIIITGAYFWAIGLIDSPLSPHFFLLKETLWTFIIVGIIYGLIGIFFGRRKNV